MPTDPKRVEALFEQARALPPAEREAFLAAACAGDPDLRVRVDQLLAAEGDLGQFLEPEAKPDPDPENLATPEKTVLAPAGFVPQPVSSAETVGMVIAEKYKLLERIGEGGMGTVYMAQQTAPVKRLVAVKLIRAGMDSAGMLARFEAERQALALMDHPNIARVLDAGTTGAGSPYFVMELVKGVPITKFCDDHKLTPRERLELFVPVCQAIQHAHQKGVIHRDIKPSNVLVALYDDRPVAKVIDFGMAKAAGTQLTDLTLVTGFGAVVGTPAYMSPEQASFNQMDVDTRSDVYSLGVLLYELLTGTTPIDRKTLARAALLEVLRIVREVESPRPSHRLSTTDALPSIAANRNIEPAKLSRLLKGELDWVVMKALEKDRDRRYATANGLAHDIQRYLADEVVQARPPSAGYRLKKFVRRHKGQVLAAGLALGALIGGFAGTTYGMIKARKHEAEAIGARDDATTAWTSEKEQRGVAERAADEAKRSAAEAIAQRKIADEKTAEALRRHQEATDQLNITIALTDFLLKDLLRQADSARFAEVGPAAVANPTMREALDRAAASLTAERIDGRFPGQPLVQAKILATVGETYRGTGQYDKAVTHLRRAAETWQTQFGADHPVTLAAVVRVAAAYHAAGKIPEALAVFDQIRESWVGQFEPKHPNGLLNLDTLNELARLYVTIGRQAEAIQLFERCRESLATRLGPTHDTTLGFTNNLATAFESSGKRDVAIKLHEEILAVRMTKSGPHHPDTLLTLNNLATAYSNSGQAAKAVPLLEQALAGQLARDGPTGQYTLQTRHNLAQAYQRCGRLAEALAHYEQVVPAARRVFQPSHVLTLRFARNWASALEEADQLARAIDLRRELLADERKVYLPDDPRLAESLALLGLTLLRADKPAEAEPALRECLLIRERKEPDAWTTFNTRSMLGGSLLGQRKFADAEPLLVAGYEGMKQRAKAIPPEFRHRLAEALDRLIAFYAAAGKPAEEAKWRVERAGYPPFVAPLPREK